MSGRNPRTVCCLVSRWRSCSVCSRCGCSVTSCPKSVRARACTSPRLVRHVPAEQSRPDRAALGEFYISSASREGNDFIDAYVYVPGGKDGKKASQTILAERVRIQLRRGQHLRRAHERARVPGWAVHQGRLDPGAHGPRRAPQETEQEHGRPLLQVFADARHDRSRRDGGENRHVPLRNRGPPRDGFDVHHVPAAGSVDGCSLRRGNTAHGAGRRGRIRAACTTCSRCASECCSRMRTSSRPASAAWSVAVIGTIGGMFLTLKALRE